MDLYPTGTKYDGIAFYFKYTNNNRIAYFKLHIALGVFLTHEKNK